MSGVVVDTSVFIEYFRGKADDSLAVLTLNNQVWLSPVVRLELLVGLRRSETTVVELLHSALQVIESFPSPDECERLLRKARGSGLFGGIPDLFIIADTLRHQATLFTYDDKMKKLAKKLGAQLLKI